MKYLKEQQEFLLEALNNCPYLMAFLNSIFPEKAYSYNKVISINLLRMFGLSDLEIFEAEMLCRDLELEGPLPYPDDSKYDIIRNHEYYNSWKKVVTTIAEQLLADSIEL